jgi:26S proteasome regulatory subunit N7
MAPWYELIIKDAGWKKDVNFLKSIQTKNTEEIKKLDAAIEDAEKNLGEMEVREAYLKKAEYYSRIGDKENAVTTFRQTYDKTVSLGHRLDIIFHLIRIGLFFMDHDIITRNIEKAKRYNCN